MSTGYEVQMYHDISAIRKALERIANAAEQSVYGVTGSEVRAAKQQLKADAERVNAERAADRRRAMDGPEADPTAIEPS